MVSNLFELEHKNPVLGVLVEGVDDELGEINAGAVRVLGLLRGVRVPSSPVRYCTYRAKFVFDEFK